MNFKTVSLYFFLTLISPIPFKGYSQYKQVTPREPSKGEIAVSKAGILDVSGATYILVNDITSERNSLFLGNNIILDLNGYTIKFADADYQQISNSGFEEGLEGWDLSRAPGAQLENTADVHVFLGEKLLSLQAGDEVRSPFVHLPVANRSYFAMCGITGRYWQDMKKYPDDEMKLSIYVEDENGNEVVCVTEYGDKTLTGCPVENKSPRLGGGFIYAHLNNLPAGKYRMRVKAETDCLIDEVDIRPAMDVGIGIVGNFLSFGHYDHMHAGWPNGTFFDYRPNSTAALPVAEIPVVKGEGKVTIKNGVIESAAPGILAWGIQSTSDKVKVVLENLHVKINGISSGAVNIPWVDIKNCRFDAEIPFLIQRHTNLCSVTAAGDNPSVVAFSEFYGGQGNLSVRGKNSMVHDNLFRNNQTVTNHYSIMGTGEGSKIFNNRFEPYQGSGIYVSRHSEVFENVFNIETSPPTCEYGRDIYSTAAIRMGDYHALPGTPQASVGTRIYKNKITVTAKNYPQPKEFIPVAWGIFYSARGGENYIYDNEITVNNIEPQSKTIAAAFYICGGPEYYGGQFFNNTITTNVPAAWIATEYGDAANTRIYNNTIVTVGNTPFETFRIGSSNYVARNIQFISNTVAGQEFKINATDKNHSYKVCWKLNVRVFDPEGNPVKDENITIFNENSETMFRGKTDEKGVVSAILPEYEVDGSVKKVSSSYTIAAANTKKTVEMTSNRDVVIFK